MRRAARLPQTSAGRGVHAVAFVLGGKGRLQHLRLEAPGSHNALLVHLSGAPKYAGYVYIYIYIYTYTYMYNMIHMYIYIYIYMCTYNTSMCISLSLSIYIYIHIVCITICCILYIIVDALHMIRAASRREVQTSFSS